MAPGCASTYAQRRVFNEGKHVSELTMLKGTQSDEPLAEDVQMALRRWPSCKGTLSELARQSYIGGPIAAMNVLWFARFIVSTIFLGHLGGLQLAGGTLALTFANVTGFSILLGLSGGMEPICSQAYGAEYYDMVDLTLQRCILLLLVTSIPILSVWYHAEQLLLFSGQDPAIAGIAKEYLVYLVPDLIATSVLAPLRIFLRSQCITKPLMVCSAIAMALHVPINYYLVMRLNLGASATALGICLTDFNLIIMLLLYIRLSDVHWSGWSFASFTGWRPLLKLAVPSCLMTCMEWWCYEIMVLLTGVLPHAKEQIAAIAIVLNGDTIFYALQVALASCVCTRVGNELGANRPVGAYYASIATLTSSVGIGCAAAAWLISARFMWAKLFTTDANIVHAVTQILPIMGLMELGNFPQTVACGILRGSARPALGALINLAAFYLLGIPIGIFLAFNLKMELFGLWIGLLTAVSACAVMTLIAVLRTDWIHQTLRAQRLINESSLSLSLDGSFEDPLESLVADGGSIQLSPLSDKLHPRTAKKDQLHPPGPPDEEQLRRGQKDAGYSGGGEEEEEEEEWYTRGGGGGGDGEMASGEDEQRSRMVRKLSVNEEMEQRGWEVSMCMIKESSMKGEEEEEEEEEEGEEEEAAALRLLFNEEKDIMTDDILNNMKSPNAKVRRPKPSKSFLHKVKHFVSRKHKHNKRHPPT